MRNLQSSQVSQANRSCVHIRLRHKICCNCNKCFTNGKAFNMIVKANLKVEIEENFWHWRLKWHGWAWTIWINLCWSPTLQHQRVKEISIQLTSNPHSIENEKILFKSSPYCVKVYNLNFLLFTPATSAHPGCWRVFKDNSHSLVFLLTLCILRVFPNSFVQAIIQSNFEQEFVLSRQILKSCDSYSILNPNMVRTHPNS